MSSCEERSRTGVACESEEPDHTAHYGRDGDVIRNWTTPAIGRNATTTECPWCAGPVVQPRTGRRRVFCCDNHRVAMHRWTKAWNAIQEDLDGKGRCYCCGRRGRVLELPTSGGQAPFCQECARGCCDPDAGRMRPRPPKEAGSYWQRQSPCVTEWQGPPSGIGWSKSKPAARRRAPGARRRAT